MPPQQPEHTAVFKLNSFEQNLISLLIDKDLYGAQIIEALERVIGRKFAFSTVYPALHKLTDKGYLVGRWGEEGPGERWKARRRFYTTSALGQRALEAMDEQRLALRRWQPGSSSTD